MREMPNDQERPQLTTGAVAREIGVTPPTVRRLIEHGHLRGWRFGRNYKTSRAAVEEFLNRSARPLAA